MFFVLTLLIAIDQITKSVFTGRDFFFKNYALPFGLDFGVRANTTVLFLAYAVVGWLLLRMKLESRLAQWGRIIFLAGAVSNLVDRIVFGYVRDFADLGLGFVFNLADVFIVVGLMMVVFIKPGSVEKTSPKV
jgi:signal peptidase II